MASPKLFVSLLAALFSQMLIGKTTMANIAPEFVCVGLDWWPANKCNYEMCPWHNASVWAIDLEEVKPYARPLSPFLLRVGGSLQDQVVFRDECNLTEQFPLEPESRIGFGEGCISKQRLNELSDFCKDVGCQFAWGLNAMFGRTSNGTGPWDSSNSAAILNHFRSIDFPLYAVTLGNELWGEFVPLTTDQAVDSFTELDRLVENIWPESAERPLIVGFDGYYSKNQPDFMSGVLAQLFDAGVRFDVLSYHSYPLGSSDDEDVVKRALTPNPGVNDLGHRLTQIAQDSPYSPSPHVWMSESGGSYNSGSTQATGSYASGFWYLNNMAMLHQVGHKHFCRQTFAGGNYGLLDQISPRTPHPDYWNAVLYTKLLGRPMPSVMLRPTDANGIAPVQEEPGTTICKSMNGIKTMPGAAAVDDESHAVKWYIYEAKKPEMSLAVLGINFNPEAACGLTLGQNMTLMVYSMTAADGHESDPWNTTITMLNGQLLEFDGSGEFPSLDGQSQTGDTLWLDPLSYAFFELNGGGLVQALEKD